VKAPIVWRGVTWAWNQRMSRWEFGDGEPYPYLTFSNRNRRALMFVGPHAAITADGPGKAAALEALSIAVGRLAPLFQPGNKS
jgi:hypothetical protein